MNLGEQMQSDQSRLSAARDIFNARVQSVKDDVQAKSVVVRLRERFAAGAKDVLEEARDVASDKAKGAEQFAKENRKAISAGLGVTAGLVGLWLAREPIKGAAARVKERVGKKSPSAKEL